MEKRIIAVLLAITMLVSVFNIGTMVVFGATPDTDVTITVLDSNGNVITDASPTVKVTCTYRRNNSNRTQNITVKSFDPGVFGYDYYESNYNNVVVQYYTVNVTLTVNNRRYTASEQVVKDADSVVITLENYTQVDKWETFKIYYIADGHFPESFYGAGAPEDYGPAGDDTPLLTINVNTTKLKTMPNVLYEQNVTNAYHFIPSQISDKENEEAYNENVVYANAFWTSVKECMDEESKKAFEATGLFKNYIVYCLKNQGSASSPNNHADGILVASVDDDEIRPIKPPVYVIEMYDHQGQIFGGFTNDENTADADFYKIEQLLEAYDNHFNQQVKWTKTEDGVWEGYYTTEENGRKYKYNLRIVQTNISLANKEAPNKIKYQKKTDTYYLATFQSEPVSVEQVAYILTYTDGIEDRVFNDQVNSLKTGEPAVAFTGKTDRENYIFLGWTLKGGDGAVLSQEEILEKYTSVKEDLTFVAVYMVAPTKYTGTVEVILDGYYNSTTATATGKKIDITTVKGNNTSLYVKKADSTEYIPLEHTSEGVYSAKLINGTYEIYYYDGENYVLSSDQYLSINNEDRIRYIFFEYVKYDLNGGIGGPESLLSYYDEGVTVKVSAKAPTKQGYIFAGWKDQDGKSYNSGDVLSAAIGKSYTLTAQWVDAADVYINVTINHNEKNGLGHDDSSVKDEITLDLVWSPNANTPYLETGDRIVITKENHPNHNYTYTPTDAADDKAKLQTVYTATAPSVIGVSKDYLYTVAVSKQEYDITSVTTSRDANGDIIIDLVLVYAPENEDLNFEVRVDENVPDHLLPQAVIVKVLSWSVEDNRWEFITEHKNTDDERKPGVRLDFNSENRVATGSYPVWVKEILDDNKTRPYGYRIVVTALVYPDGTIVETNWAEQNLRQVKTDLYTVTFGDVADGKAFGTLNGAYFEEGVQKGKLDAVITGLGYNVIFDAQGGKVNGFDKQKLENQYKVPYFDGFVPVRNGGYVFEGWYLDADCTSPATEGVYLSNDITLYAKWREPLTIEGIITVGATYEQKNEDGSVTIQKIPQSEWVKSLIVLLQRVEPNGYTDTVNQQFVFLDYKNTAYYHEGREVGFATYSFTGIADIGNQYRIQVLIPNYSATFQNEDESIEKPLNYPSYNLNDYIADFGTEDTTKAIVNVHAHFSPEEFELKYSVDAEQIGDGFKPQQTEVLVTFDERNTGVIPSLWTVISQMVFDDKLIGNFVEIKNGKGEGSNYVWIRRADGITDYQYGIRVQNVVLADGTKILFSENSPFTVEYKAPAYYMDGAQVGDLVATLIPKTYNVIYNTNGGTLSGSYPTEHTWSFETSISGVTPTFDGFKFDGWYLDKNFTQPAGDVIDASVAADVNLYAKWIQVMDTVDLIVTVKHNQLNSDGLAGNFDKTLYAQLTYAERGLSFEEQVYIDMPGFSKQYDDGLWHTHGDKVKVDVFEVPSFYTNLSEEYDYSVNVMLEGYYVAEKTVTKSDPRPDGSILHTVNVTLQYNPELFDMHFYVQMAKGVEKKVYPQSAEVRVTSWYDDPAVATACDWIRITQHKFTTITVNIDPETGYGDATYPVWRWYDKEEGKPYHYRLEVIQLNFADGTAVTMNETLADVSYSGGAYNAEVVVEGGAVPETENENQSKTKLTGVYVDPKNPHIQKGTVGAVIDVNRVVFHANNSEAIGDDVFRTYYPNAIVSSDEVLTLNADGTVSQFYDIPQFDYYKHNKYVFKGWYLDEESDDRPIDWSDSYNGTTHIYAHWIETGSVAKDEADDKQTTGNSYAGFDLIGVQIREAEADNINHYGDAGSGLRFITVLSDELYSEINAISGSVAEYGFVLARSFTAWKNAGDNADYTLQLKGDNVNGVNTNLTHSYVQNVKCSGVADHYEGENYRLYTAVITYKNYTTEKLEEEYQQEFAARSYISYTDANGVERVYYNNYTGTQFYGGCSASFAAVRDIVTN